MDTKTNNKEHFQSNYQKGAIMTASYWQDRAIENKGDMFLAILAAQEMSQNIPDYPFRDKFPEQVLKLADWFVETTKLKPNGHNYKKWIKAIIFANDAGYTMEDWENGWLHTGEGENITITDPLSLLGIVGERKARRERREEKYKDDKLEKWGL